MMWEDIREISSVKYQPTGNFDSGNLLWNSNVFVDDAYA